MKKIYITVIILYFIVQRSKSVLGFIILLITITFFVWPIIAFKKKDKELWTKELKACGWTILVLIILIIAIDTGTIRFGGGVWDGIINAFDGLFYMFLLICTVAVILLEFLLSLCIGSALFRKSGKTGNTYVTNQQSNVPSMPEKTPDILNTEADDNNLNDK